MTLITLFTASTEYHLTDGICKAVRNRRTGEWRRKHPTLGKRIYGQQTNTRHSGIVSPGREVRPMFRGSSWIEPTPVNRALINRRRFTLPPSEAVVIMHGD